GLAALRACRVHPLRRVSRLSRQRLVRVLRKDAVSVPRGFSVTELTRLSLKALRNGLAAKDFTALEATDAYLDAIEAGNGALNAYVAVTADKARDMARASDEKLAKGEG